MGAHRVLSLDSLADRGLPSKLTALDRTCDRTILTFIGKAFGAEVLQGDAYRNAFQGHLSALV